MRAREIGVRGIGGGVLARCARGLVLILRRAKCYIAALS
jgi:hypothetical protein